MGWPTFDVSKAVDGSFFRFFSNPRLQVSRGQSDLGELSISLKHFGTNMLNKHRSKASNSGQQLRPLCTPVVFTSCPVCWILWYSMLQMISQPRNRIVSLTSSTHRLNQKNGAATPTARQKWLRRHGQQQFGRHQWPVRGTQWKTLAVDGGVLWKMVPVWLNLHLRSSIF